MTDLNDSLLALFEELRRKGVPLGVSEYLDTIALIQAGFGLSSEDSQVKDKDNFKQLLQLLWTKSQEDQELFDELFDNQFQQFFIDIEERAKEKEGDGGDRGGKEVIKTPSQKIPPIGLVDPPVTPHSVSSEGEKTSQGKGEEQPVILPPLKPPQKRSDRTIAPRHYQLIPQFPMSQRDMAGAWRQLRRPQRVGVPEELDVDATIDSFARSGFLIRPVLRPRRRNLSRLVVLVDRQGSMTPFHPWIDTAIESIIRGGLLGRVSFYYFHDCPEIFLYRHPNLTGTLLLETVLAEQVMGSSVLIISDAGAAQGYFDSLRVSDTKEFLHKLHSHTYLYAWVNPMPKKRWVATTAEDIARLVPMFPLDREGLNDAVNILRGQPFPVGVGLNEPN